MRVGTAPAAHTGRGAESPWDAVQSACHGHGLRTRPSLSRVGFVVNPRIDEEAHG